MKERESEDADKEKADMHSRQGDKGGENEHDKDSRKLEDGL